MAHEEGLVENLVTQFSSAYDCLRELVQNSIDAGSPQIETWTEYERGEGHRGVIAIHVDDFGEGMDEHIIDTQLTTLFASAKENDLTKIGKFGIGFVSVFALKPKGVLLHTGRAGEYWEVFFHEDRSFSKTQLDFPVEGTQITIFLEGDYRRYKEMAREVRSTLKHWCKHSETEITFEDRSPEEGKLAEVEPINEPFEVPGDCLVNVAHQGSEMVLAYTSSPHYGFYNRGLALAYSRHGEDVLFERAERYRQIGFKIKSRYLEHTLSRETIMRDANYEKAMQLLDAAVEQELLGALAAAIEELAAAEQWRHTEARRYIHLIGLLAAEPNGSVAQLSQKRMLRTLHSAPLSLEETMEVWRRDGRVLFSQSASTLTERLAAMGVPVIYGAAQGQDQGALIAPRELFVPYASEQLLSSTKGRVVGFLRGIGLNLTDVRAKLAPSLVTPEQAFLPVVLDKEREVLSEQLLEGASALLERIGAGYAELAICRMGVYVEQAPLFVIAPQLDTFMARPPAHSGRRKMMSVAVNADHALFKRLRGLSQSEPQMARYMLAKSLLLEEDRLLERDVELIGYALERAS